MKLTDTPAIKNVYDLPLLLSREQVAQLANVDPRTVFTWLKNGEVPGAVRQGGKWIVNRDVLLKAWKFPAKAVKVKAPRKKRVVKESLTTEPEPVEAKEPEAEVMPEPEIEGVAV